MKPHSRAPEQDGLRRPKLTEMIDTRYGLVTLASLIDGEFREREWTGFFPSTTDHPAGSPGWCLFATPTICLTS
jgi:hypothetical protein